MSTLPASAALDRAKRVRYVMPNGKRVPAAELARIKALVIPPAWTDVWICPDPRGHLQATGRDARGRKQYRYHPRWREVRDEVKYGRLIAFAQALPRIRQRTEADLRKNRSAAREGAGRGGAAAREDADSRRQRGVRARQRVVRPDDDAREARDDQGRDGALRVPRQERRRARDRPAGRAAGAHRQGDAATCRATSCSSTSTRTARRQAIDSADVNDYLREISGEDFTAKDFRTWAGTVLAAKALAEVADVQVATPKPSGTSSRRSSRWPSGSATPRRSAASATSTRRFSMPTWTARRSRTRSELRAGPTPRSSRAAPSPRRDCRRRHHRAPPAQDGVVSGAAQASRTRPSYNRRAMASRGLKAVGRNVLRKEGVEKVTGAARYIDDLPFPDLLHARTIRSTIPAGEIADIRFDFDTAGFTIVDHRDIPGRNVVALIDDDQPCLAERTIRHVAEPILLLAHEDRERLLGRRGADRLPRDDARSTTRSVADGRSSGSPSTRATSTQGFAAADVIVEGEYRTGHQEQLYIETNGVIAVPGADGAMTVYGSMQCPYYVHRALEGAARAARRQGPRRPDRDRRRLRRQGRVPVDDCRPRGAARAQGGAAGEAGLRPRRGHARDDQAAPGGRSGTAPA